jgi:hypothetical protein
MSETEWQSRVGGGAAVLYCSIFFYFFVARSAVGVSIGCAANLGSAPQRPRDHPR